MNDNNAYWSPASKNYKIKDQKLKEILKEKLLNIPISKSVEIESMALFYNKKEDVFVVRARSSEGAEGFAVPNPRINYLYPILLQRIFPYFTGKDAREIENLIDGIYRYKSNYKLTGLALWNCVAWAEFSILDMLGRICQKSIAEMFGGKIREKIDIYLASYRRDTTPEEEVELLKQEIQDQDVKAVKIRVGGRMSNDRDSMPGRTDNLIPLVRKELGDNIDIHADANGSYSVDKAVEVARMLEEIDAVFFEEPCPLDHLEETKKVNQKVNIPIAFGEQETSMRRFRWLIKNNALRIIQPDLEYNGGFIRCTRVAKMAKLAKIPITPHISGKYAFIYSSNFTSYIENIGYYQEFNGLDKINSLTGNKFKVDSGVVNIPEGPGLGLGDNIKKVAEEGNRITE
ncbi:MAG: mandelate racemase/muconate lactonizing enzyme family protein [Halanaerobiales bacterium]